MTTTLVNPTVHAIEEAQEGRTRLWVERFLQVRDKNNALIPFRHHAITNDLDVNGTHYYVLCKPRQVHVTTYHLAKAFALCSNIPFFQAAVIEHEKEASERVFQRVHQFHRFLPEGLAPELDASRDDYIRFKALESSLYIGTAGGRKFGRAETINWLLLDEFAHYTDAQAEELWTGAPEAVPIGGYILIASTPNGLGNRFHRLYVDASEGKTRFQALFYPWFMHEEYTLGSADPEALLKDRVSPLEYNLEEAELAAKGLTEGQIRWRRSKLAEKGKAFYQEFPEDDVSCFIATTNSVFPVEILQAMLKGLPEPIESRENGQLRLWMRPHPSHRYSLGADPAEGLKGGDPSSATLMDGQTGRTVAVLHGQIPIHDFARKLADLGTLYNGALLVVERTNHGHAVLEVLRNLGYSNIYAHRQETVTPGMARLGFPTSQASKTQLVANTKAGLEAGDITILDKETIREMVEYRTDETEKRYSAAPGGHDDRVISTMLAYHGRITSPWVSVNSAVQRRLQVGYWPAGV